MENKGFFHNLTAYFSDVKAELKKVTWPTFNDIIRHTVIVLLFTFIVALVLGLMDSVILGIFQLTIFKKPF